MASSAQEFKYHELIFSICVSHLFPAYPIECVHTMQTVPESWRLFMAVLSLLLLLFLYFPLTPHSSPDVYWSITLNQQKG